MNKPIPLAIALLVMAFAACSTNQPVEPTEPEAQQPTTEAGARSPAVPTGDYTLTSLNGVAVLEGATITMVLGENGAEGSAGCNQYFAVLDSITPDGLRFGSIEATERACPEPEGVMEQEAAFLRAMSAVESFSIENETLRMTGEGAELIWSEGAAPAEAVEPTAPEGISFQEQVAGDYELLTLNGTPVLDGTTITMTLPGPNTIEDGVSGSAGCNQYGGRITALAEDAISWGPIISTQMACLEPEGIMEQEAAFLQAMSSVDSFVSASENADADLIMVGEGVELRWARSAGAEGRGSFASTLAGAWVLREFEGRQPVVPATIIFTEGSIAGNAGCNDYGSTFTIVEGDSVSLGDVISTDMACAEPAGVMEFEAAFLNALTTVRAVEPRGEARFAMLNAAGETVMVWEATDGGR